MIMDVKKITLEEGRNHFGEVLKKYGFEGESLETLKDYYGYFWNYANNENVPKIQVNMLLSCANAFIGEMIKKDIEKQLMEDHLLMNGKIGFTFLETKEDVAEIVEFYNNENRKDQYESLIVALSTTNKEFDASQMLYEAGTQLYYRDLRYHVDTPIKEDVILCYQIIEELLKRVNVTEAFKEELLVYVQHVLPHREIIDNDAFVGDIVERVYNKYLGKFDFASKKDIDQDCIPFYIKNKEPEEHKGLFGWFKK